MEDNKITLINVYNDNPCLWNCSLAEYHDRNKRNLILNGLAKEIRYKGLLSTIFTINLIFNYKIYNKYYLK